MKSFRNWRASKKRFRIEDQTKDNLTFQNIPYMEISDGALKVLNKTSASQSDN